jgi:hypothetical protein
VAACAVWEDERARVRTTVREVELDELARDRLEELGLAGAPRLRRRELFAGEGPLDAQAPAWLAVVVEDVAPLEGVRLGLAETL